MKKVLLILIPTLFVAGCTEKAEYEKAVLEQMEKDQDIKDYNIEPTIMVNCVVETSSKKMPGLVAIDPSRREAYKNYTTMLRLYDTSDPRKTLDELRDSFGSAKALADAHANYAESVVECVSGLVTSEEETMK
ncbi:hypothetical protein [Methylomonas sp. MgM2]